MVVTEEPRTQELLGIPDFCAVAALIALGKPTRQITKLKRKSVDEFVTWERFDGPVYSLAGEPRGNPDGSATTQHHLPDHSRSGGRIDKQEITDIVNNPSKPEYRKES